MTDPKQTATTGMLNFEQVKAELAKMNGPSEVELRALWISERDRFQALIEGRAALKAKLQARWIELAKEILP